MKKILVVEDEEDEAKVITQILEREGYSSKTVDTVDKAFKELKTGKYDLVLLDIILPLKLGNELLVKMKEAKIKTPVIVITAISDKMTGVKKDLKAINKSIGFIEKPFDSKTLLKEIRKKI